MDGIRSPLLPRRSGVWEEPHKKLSLGDGVRCRSEVAKDEVPANRKSLGPPDPGIRGTQTQCIFLSLSPLDDLAGSS